VSAEVGTQQKMLQITDALIERARKQAAATAKK
jgi:hypothetical protein